jgi:hypothetical protein
VFIFVVYFFIDSARKLLDTRSYVVSTSANIIKVYEIRGDEINKECSAYENVRNA